MPVRLVAHDSEQPRYFEDVQDEVFKTGELGRTLAAFDADGTMFEDDLGILFFLQKLLDPQYWKAYSVKNFRKLLLPKAHREMIEKGAHGDDPKLDKGLCQFALDLAEDIINIYREIKREFNNNNGQTEDPQKIHNHPLVNEFARKMIELDGLTMVMDKIISERLNEELLLRTRFLANRLRMEVRELASKVWDPSNQDISLRISPEKKINGTAKKVTEDHPGILPKVRYIRRKPVVDRRVLEVAHRVLIPGDSAMIRVVTTNQPIVIDEAIQLSDWREILHSQAQGIRPEDHLVRGTRLSANSSTQRLEGTMMEKPIIGARKSEIVRKIEKANRRLCRIAAGDTLGDLQMGLRAALENNGIFLVVVPRNGGETPEEKLERIRGKFHKELTARLQGSEFKKAAGRIHYILP